MNIEGYLARRLTASKGWTAYAPVSEEEIEAMVAELRKPPAEIDLFVELGVLDEADAEVWRGRWAARDLGYEPPEGARERAAAHLAAIDRTTDNERHFAAFIIYEQLGLYEQPAADEDERGYSVPMDDEEDQPERVALRTLTGPDFEVAGLTVTEIVIYHHHAEVRWRFDDRAEDASAHIKLHMLHSGYADDEPYFVLADDVGTQYSDEEGSCSWSEGEGATCTTRFEPAPPEDARVLNVVVDGAAIKLLLR